MNFKRPRVIDKAHLFFACMFLYKRQPSMYSYVLRLPCASCYVYQIKLCTKPLLFIALN